MGGIVAVATFDGAAVDASVVDPMLRAAPYRGLDGTATWYGEGAALARQRRVILPEDAGDEQPLVRAGFVLVADARIDNREELSKVLSRRGVLPDLPGLPDAEFVLAAYRLWGTACPARLVGDFAFALWDSRSRTLFAARDPMGMRALHVRWEDRRRVLVATEAKQVLAAPGVPRELFEPAIAATLAGPFLPPSWTAYAGVEQLPPGHAMTAGEQGRRVWRAWTPEPGQHFHPREERAAQEAFGETLDRAVQDRLRAAGPVGIFLSGGMDSGSVASLAGRVVERGASSTCVRTYSWAFDELVDSDERSVSDLVVARYGLHGTAVPGDEAWPLAGYPQHGPDEDDPYTWVYQALVERTLARCRDDGVRVVLSGDRGDEVTGDWVFDELGLLRAGRVRDALTDFRAAAGAPAQAWGGLRRAVVRPVVAAHWPALTARRARRQVRPWPPWVPDAFAVRTELGDLIAAARTPAPFDGAARTLRHQRVFMPQAARIAVLRERTRARSGMGFADPYADRRLHELVLSMPQWLVQRRTRPKALARGAMAGVMPEAARVASRKTVPYGLFDRGFRDHAVPVVEDLLTGSQAARRGWLDEGAALDVYRGYVASGDSPLDFWWPITVEMWLRRWWS